MAYADKVANSAVERIRQFADTNPRSVESQKAIEALDTIAAFVVKRER